MGDTNTKKAEKSLSVEDMEACDDFFKAYKKKIIVKAVNCLLAGGLVFLGAFISGNISGEAIVAAFAAAGITAINQFKEFWQTLETQETPKITSFLL